MGQPAPGSQLTKDPEFRSLLENEFKFICMTIGCQDLPELLLGGPDWGKGSVESGAPDRIPQTGLTVDAIGHRRGRIHRIEHGGEPQ
jgi:hypothetical protein